MANEKQVLTNCQRLIDANALLAELDKFVNPMPDAYGLHFLNGLSTAITEIEDAPIVDAVEVVHCCDCQNCTVFQQFADSEVLLFCEKWKGHPLVDPTDFCSYGERREGE